MSVVPQRWPLPAPGRSRITSPHDLNAHCGVQRDTFCNGYQVHITETCDTSAAADNSSDGDGEAIAPPHLITNVETTDPDRARQGR